MQTNGLIRELTDLLKRYGLDETKLRIVPEPYLLAKELGVNNIRNDDIAFALKSMKTIVLKAEINEADIQQFVSATDIRVISSCNKRLRTDVAFFIKHLLLHEIAHIVKGIPQSRDEDADAFAFRELGCEVSRVISKGELR